MPETEYTKDFLYQLDSSYANSSKLINLPAVREVSQVFDSNVFRAMSLAQLPEFIARGTRRVTIVTEFAKSNIFSAAPEDVQNGTDDVRLAYCAPRMDAEMLRIDRELFPPGPETLQEERYHSSGMLKTMFEPDATHAAKNPVQIAVGSIYISLMISVWTAFEAMAGDLWETAINTHPKILADLSGAEKRISKLAGIARSQTSDADDGVVSEGEIKISDLRRITKGDYQIADKMGTLLKRRFRFTILEGIRAAYSEAFSKDGDRIDAVLSNKSLDALNALRNVFVHKAGISDDEYWRKCGSIPDLPKFDVNQKVVLDGKTVRERVNSVILCGMELLAATDSWISTHSA